MNLTSAWRMLFIGKCGVAVAEYESEDYFVHFESQQRKSLTPFERMQGVPILTAFWIIRRLKAEVTIVQEVQKTS
ncbi:unnamed protein product [Ceratitis capitata]|uniref:(Mediterranean fruit fly) hypothetical protein n=1 Tax=Ceratitis capitata TaxID=7213 RepID=A0A811VAT1_CERCA|nr:unnamed protein product [Ceratitis capitata]